jgi:hypothetical protein
MISCAVPYAVAPSMRCDAREVVKTKDLAPACLFGASGRPGRPDGRPEDGDKKAGFGARGRKASKAGREREREREREGTKTMEKEGKG